MKVGVITNGYNPYNDYATVMNRSASMRNEFLGRSDAEEKAAEIESAVVKQDEPAFAPKIDIKSLLDEEMQGVDAVAEKKSANEDISSIADSLKNIQDFETIGRDSNIEKLDTQQAVSGMRRDSVLLQYQFFVGTQDASGSDPYGTFFQKNSLY